MNEIITAETAATRAKAVTHGMERERCLEKLRYSAYLETTYRSSEGMFTGEVYDHHSTHLPWRVRWGIHKQVIDELREKGYRVRRGYLLFWDWIKISWR